MDDLGSFFFFIVDQIQGIYNLMKSIVVFDTGFLGITSPLSLFDVTISLLIMWVILGAVFDGSPDDADDD